MQKKIQADWKHNGSFLLNAPWQNPWSSGPWQNPWMLRFIISMGFAMELWENPLHGKTHISWVLPWYMGFAIDLWQNPLDTLFRPRHAVPCRGKRKDTMTSRPPSRAMASNASTFLSRLAPGASSTSGTKACSPTFATPWRWRRWVRWPRCTASWQFLVPLPSGMQDIPPTGVLAAIWLPEGWKQLPTDPTPHPKLLVPCHLCLRGLRGQYHIPSGVFCYPWQKGLYLAKVWGSPPFSFYIFTYILIYVHPTDWKLMPCRYSGRSSLGVARSVAPPFITSGNSFNICSFYWKLIALWQ